MLLLMMMNDYNDDNDSDVGDVKNVANENILVAINIMNVNWRSIYFYKSYKYMRCSVYVQRQGDLTM